MIKTLELVAQSGDLALTRRLTPLTPAERVTHLRELIRESLAGEAVIKDASGGLLGCYDKRMCLLVMLVLTAKEDEIILPAIEKLGPEVRCDHERFAKQEVGDDWLLDLAELAVDLEKALPKPPQRSRREYLSPGGVNYYHPVYTQTRLLIYNHLLEAWSQIHDDENASIIFASFLELTWSDYYDEKALGEIKQKFEGLSFTSYRLEKAIILIANHMSRQAYDTHKFLLNVLKHLWVKKLDQSRLAALMRISHQLPEEASAVTWQSLEEEAKELYPVDRMAATLISALGGRGRWSVSRVIKRSGPEQRGFIVIDYVAKDATKAEEMSALVQERMKSEWWNNPENPDAKRAEILFNFFFEGEKSEEELQKNYRYFPSR